MTLSVLDELLNIRCRLAFAVEFADTEGNLNSFSKSLKSKLRRSSSSSISCREFAHRLIYKISQNNPLADLLDNYFAICNGVFRKFWKKCHVGPLPLQVSSLLWHILDLPPVLKYEAFSVTSQVIHITSNIVSLTAVIGVQFRRGRSTLARTFLLTVRLRNVGGGAGGVGIAGESSVK